MIRLLSNTKIPKNIIQQIIIRNLPRNLPKRIQRITNMQCSQLTTNFAVNCIKHFIKGSARFLEGFEVAGVGDYDVADVEVVGDDLFIHEGFEFFDVGFLEGGNVGVGFEFEKVGE